MRKLFYTTLFCTLMLVNACTNDTKENKTTNLRMEQKGLKNEAIRQYAFLDEMYNDSYFPDHLVDKGKKILVELCFQIEQQKPKDLDALYALTHAATDRFNDLQEEFNENDSEIETAARDCIATDFEFIAQSYGFDADIEELVATRDW